MNMTQTVETNHYKLSSADRGNAAGLFDIVSGSYVIYNTLRDVNAMMLYMHNSLYEPCCCSVTSCLEFSRIFVLLRKYDEIPS